MLIFDFPYGNTNSSFSERVAVIGSCRVMNPMRAKIRQGQIAQVWHKPPYTHTVEEALQILQLAQQKKTIPSAFSAYVFGRPIAPSYEDLSPSLLDSIDTFVVEISTRTQVICQDYCFQSNYFSVEFIQKYGAALLGWYRNLTLNRPVTSELIQASMAAFEQKGWPFPEQLETILRNTRFKNPDAQSLSDLLGKLTQTYAKRWLIVSHFSTDDQTATMVDRRRLTDDLQLAAQNCGAEFYNPSILLQQFGREKVLDNKGTNINEYAPKFVNQLGDILLERINPRIAHCEGERKSRSQSWQNGLSLLKERMPAQDMSSIERADPVSDKGSPLTAPSGHTKALPGSPIDDLAKSLNQLMIDFFKIREQELGVNDSGLYAHYKALLDKSMLVPARTISLCKLLANHLPEYQRYVIGKAGIGELAFMLALSGHKVIAYEANKFRNDAIRALATHLAKQGQQHGSRLKLALRPAASALHFGNMTPGANLAIGLTVPEIAKEKDLIEFSQKISKLEGLLLDLRIRKHSEHGTEHARIRQTLHEAGFPRCREYPAQGYTLFTRTDVPGLTK